MLHILFHVLSLSANTLELIREFFISGPNISSILHSINSKLFHLLHRKNDRSVEANAVDDYEIFGGNIVCYEVEVNRVTVRGLCPMEKIYTLL